MKILDQLLLPEEPYEPNIIDGVIGMIIIIILLIPFALLGWFLYLMFNFLDALREVSHALIAIL